MFYPFECDGCGFSDDLQFGMNDAKEADCPECGMKLTRVFTVPHLTGDLNYRYDYIDPTLGPITSRRQREEKMKEMGLVEYHESPETMELTKDRMRIRKECDIAKDSSAYMEHEQLGKKKAEIKKRAKVKSETDKVAKEFDRAVHKAIQQTGVDVN